MAIEDHREEDLLKTQCEEIERDESEEDEDRVDMLDITGKKDIEKRREKFLQAQKCKLFSTTLYSPLL